MTTVDSNGLVQFTQPDDLTPLAGAFNLLSSSVSTALNSTVRTFKVANQAARNALATQRTPTADNPLQVWRQDKKYFEINDGTGWVSWSPDPNKAIVNGEAYQASGSWTGPFTYASWTQQGTSGVWRGSINNLTLPFSVPDGWGVECFVLHSGGFTFVDTGVLTGGSALQIRVAQIGSNDTGFLTRIGWRLASMEA